MVVAAAAAAVAAVVVVVVAVAGTHYVCCGAVSFWSCLVNFVFLGGGIVAPDCPVLTPGAGTYLEFGMPTDSCHLPAIPTPSSDPRSHSHGRLFQLPGVLHPGG